MSLSKIWSAFIIIAIVVAGIKSIGFSDGKTIFTNMVTGKSGDTIRVKLMDSSLMGSPFLQQLDSNKVVVQGDTKLIRYNEGKLLQFKIQAADGIIETCQTAVTLCLRLIGFMALFMGFMSIAEKAGGIRFLSRIIGPFFSRIFPEIPKGHPSMGHMMMNFSANLLFGFFNRA